MVFGLGSGEMWATALLGPVGLLAVGLNRIANGWVEQVAFGAAPGDELSLAASVGRVDQVKLLQAYQTYAQQRSDAMAEGEQGKGYLRVCARLAADLRTTFVDMIRLVQQLSSNVRPEDSHQAQQMQAKILFLSEKSKEMYISPDEKNRDAFYACCDEVLMTSSEILQTIRTRAMSVTV